MADWRTIEKALLDFCRQEGVDIVGRGDDVCTEGGINLPSLARYLEEASERWPTK